MLEENNVPPLSREGSDPTEAFGRLFEVAAEHFPYPVLLATTDVGEVLPLIPHPLPDRCAVQVMYRGLVAGFIALDDYPEFCMRIRNGEPFEAVVSENYGGRCRVVIRPAA